MFIYFLKNFNYLNIIYCSKHENYNSKSLINDIAILKLSQEVELNKYIQPACLPFQSTNYQSVNTESYAVGWEFTNEHLLIRNVKLTVCENSLLLLVTLRLPDIPVCPGGVRKCLYHMAIYILTMPAM